MNTLTYGSTVYEVEVLPEREGPGIVTKIPYRLKGPRDGRYLLMRNLHRPEHLFVLNERAGRTNTPFEWVHEKAPGVLEVIR